MTKRSLKKILWRSCFIQTALNFRRMQNLGFAYAMIPMLREQQPSRKKKQDTLVRHLQMFNTHPYLSALIIGSLVRMEEEIAEGSPTSSVEVVKQSLMGPYAAIGDTFFWGSLRPCAGIIAAAVAWWGGITAPLAFLAIFSPTHLWVRCRGFMECYRQGKQGIEFIRKINLPSIAFKVRWLALLALSCFGIWVLHESREINAGVSLMVMAPALTATVLLCWFLVTKGVSQIFIAYGTAIILLIFSSRDLFTCWK